MIGTDKECGIEGGQVRMSLGEKSIEVQRCHRNRGSYEMPVLGAGFGKERKYLNCIP